MRIQRLASLLACLALSLTARAQVQTDWVRKRLVPPTWATGMVFDEILGRPFVFGGFIPPSSGAPSAVTDLAFQWHGSGWTEDTAELRPPGRAWPQLAYDSLRGTVVLYGGYDGAARSDTWEWNGSSWAQKSSPLTPPPLGDAIGFDTARGRTVLLAAGETWLWDGNEWARPAVASGPALGTWAMDFDSTRQVLVAFGASGTGQGETWEWDGSSWSLRIPQNSPLAREGHALAFDPTRGCTVLFGGTLNATGCAGDLWEWNGVDWTEIKPVFGPSARWTHAMAFDPLRQTVLLFGGKDCGTVPLSDTWEWNGSTWNELSPGDVPRSRWGPGIGYDSRRERVVLFGGSLPFSRSLDDTWEWDGLRWIERHPTTVPTAATDPRVVFDPVRGVTILFSLFGQWSWDGNDWTRLHPTIMPPGLDYAAAFDTDRGVLVFYGDRGHWEWDGTDWTQVFPPTIPTSRTFHAMAYDPGRRRIVLYGGAPTLNDTWEYDGTTWTHRFPASRPGKRFLHAMVFDPVRQRVLLHGGASKFGSPVNSATNETWEWDGNDWAQVQTPSAPPPRMRAPLVWDAAQERVVLFGGLDESTSNDVHSETWVFGETSTSAAWSYGAGCSGSNGVPTLGAFGTPVLGSSTFALEVLFAPPLAPVFLALATAPDSIPVGTAGCTLLVQLSSARVFGVTADGSGFAHLGASLPPDPSLLGASFFAQAAVLDNAGSWGNFSLSAGLGMTLGD